MALKAPEAPNLHFKEREGFITTASDEEESTEEVVEEESGEEESTEETVEEDDFWNEEVEDEAAVEEVEEVEEVPADEGRTIIERPIERREPSVKIKPADAGGRTGSALPTPSEMAAYAQNARQQEYTPSNDRGKAILREFEEEDRRLAEQMSTSKKEEPIFKPPFSMESSFSPPSGGMKWLVLIVILTVLGFMFVRQLATGASRPPRIRQTTPGVKVTLGSDNPPPPPPKPIKTNAKKDDTKHIEIRI